MILFLLVLLFEIFKILVVILPVELLASFEVLLTKAAACLIRYSSPVTVDKTLTAGLVTLPNTGLREGVSLNSSSASIRLLTSTSTFHSEPAYVVAVQLSVIPTECIGPDRTVKSTRRRGLSFISSEPKKISGLARML